MTLRALRMPLLWCLFVSLAGASPALPQGADSSPMAQGLRLKDPDWAVRKDAAAKLRAMGAGAVSAIPQLSDALVDTSAAVRQEVLEAFAAMGSRAGDVVPTIAILLRHEDLGTRLLTVDVLGRIGVAQGSVGPLKEALLDDEPSVRAASAKVLGGMGAASLPAAPRLVRIADTDTSELARTAAREALPKIAPAKDLALRVATGLRSTSVETRLITAQSLGEMGTEARPAVPAIRRAFRDPEASVRFAAASTAIVVAPESASVKKGVLALVANPKEDRLERTQLARQAKAANLTLSEAAPALIEQAKSPDLLLRKGAVVLLGLLRPVTEPAIQALVGALHDESTDVRGLAAEALGEIGPGAKAALPELDHMMKTDHDSSVRLFASAAYYRISPGE